MIVTAAARPTSIRAILFDLDDTLIDHTSAAHNAAAAWARELGLPGDQTDRWFAIERQHFAAYERGECTHQQQRRNRVRDFLGDFSLDDAATDALFARFLTLYEQHWRAFPDAVPALTRALETGLQVGILTNGAMELQQRKLKRTGLDISGVQLLTSTGLGPPSRTRSATNARLQSSGPPRTRPSWSGILLPMMLKVPAQWA